MHLLLLAVPNDSAIQYSVVSVTDAFSHPFRVGAAVFVQRRPPKDPLSLTRGPLILSRSLPQLPTARASGSKRADYFSPGPATHNTPSPPRLRLGTSCTTLPGKAGEDRQPPPCIRSHTADTDLSALAATPSPPAHLLKGPCILGSCQQSPLLTSKEGSQLFGFGPDQFFFLFVISKVWEVRVSGNWPWTLA